MGGGGEQKVDVLCRQLISLKVKAIGYVQQEYIIQFIANYNAYGILI